MNGGDFAFGDRRVRGQCKCAPPTMRKEVVTKQEGSGGSIVTEQ